jgi:nucleoside 2-deoxyribosyltransferase
MTNQDCPFERPIQEHLAKKKMTTFFVVSPFGYPYDDIYTNIIRPAAKAANIVLDRADRVFQLGFVMCRKICKMIQEADYIVADVTEDNPNVFYELGLAWGFGKKVLLLRDRTTPEELYPDRPDLREFREALPAGWLVATNLNNILKKTIIQLATEVAGLTFGKDVIVEF